MTGKRDSVACILFVLAVLVLGVCLLQSVRVNERVLAARRQGGWPDLFEDVPFILRFHDSLLLIIRAAFSFGSKWISVVPVCLRTACDTLLANVMMVMRADQTFWQQDAIVTAGLILLSAGLCAIHKRLSSTKAQSSYSLCIIDLAPQESRKGKNLIAQRVSKHV